MILPIEIYGSPILRKMSENISSDYPNLNKIIEDMFETMYKADGIGLAAPQVGLNIRLIVIDADCMSDDDPSVAEFKVVLINPVIKKREGDIYAYQEGCLSLPGIREEVKRPSVITMEYLDENFNLHTEVFDGLKARIIQHEYDHIEATLFIDHLSPLKRKLLRSKLNTITKGEHEAAYKTRSLK
jgi:peptide deformylase